MNIKHLYPPPPPAIKISLPEQGPPPTQSELRARLRAALHAAADPVTLTTITMRLVDEAKMGNQWAMKLLFETLAGKPETETPDATKKMLSPTEIDKMLADMGYVRKSNG